VYNETEMNYSRLQKVVLEYEGQKQARVDAFNAEPVPKKENQL
jgi:hypothetical protein